MTTKPKTRKEPASAPAIDPVFAAIAEHKARAKEWGRLSSKLDEAWLEARKTHGERAGIEWGHRVGIAPLLEQSSRADTAKNRAVMRMARVKPTTQAGAAAMVDHARRELETPSDGYYGDWVTTALKTAASALVRMSRTA
jgi:hypothetical protein